MHQDGHEYVASDRGVEGMTLNGLWVGVLGGQITAAPVPGAVPYAHASQGSGMSLSWDPPTSGGAVVGYRVQYQVDGTSTWANIAPSTPDFIGAGVTSLTLESNTAYDGNNYFTTVLQFNVAYHFRIVAYNASGESLSTVFTGDVPGYVGIQ